MAVYRKGWSRTQKILSSFGLPFAIAGIVLLVLTPLKTDQKNFYIGMVIFALSTLAFVKSLFDFKNVPSGKPAMVRLYRWSRNPQWIAFAAAVLSFGVMVDSYLIMLLVFVRIILNHSRILGEEHACREIFGGAFQDYMKKVPRHFWFIRQFYGCL
jgi:protein-S-isoprenylcysteine O-methyltransferase Ste14